MRVLARPASVVFDAVYVAEQIQSYMPSLEDFQYLLGM